jgi:DNA invertase Pin-like site-specific DNA recombinase
VKATSSSRQVGDRDVPGPSAGGVEFHAVDFAQANRLTVHILAAVAEHEAKVISERTRPTLAAAKLLGVKLGGYRGTTITKAMRKAAAEAAAKRTDPRAHQ